MPDFTGSDLRDSHFDRADLTGARFTACDLSGVRMRSVNLSGAVLNGADLVDVAIDGDLRNVSINGDLQNVTVNGVDIAPLIEAELDRRDPERAAMRPVDLAGFRAAWAILERRWAQTIERARLLPPEALHESVDGEWSFIETLRHLAFATDAWVGRVILGDPSPWDPLDLPWDEMPDTEGIPRDRSVRPSLETVLKLREDRVATVRRLLAGLTEQQLAADTTPVEAPGWPRPQASPVHECLLIVLNEEWEHRNFAERDLAKLAG